MRNPQGQNGRRPPRRSESTHTSQSQRVDKAESGTAIRRAQSQTHAVKFRGAATKLPNRTRKKTKTPIVERTNNDMTIAEPSNTGSTCHFCPRETANPSAEPNCESAKLDAIRSERRIHPDQGRAGL
ncbi:unnamed protein product [Ixodes pacificus]